ncbi:MAG: hypothetical protein WDA08_11515 [Weeksellaceae bacterium]
MKIKTLIQIALGLSFLLWSCKEKTVYQGNHDPEVIKTYRNSTAVTKMDSLTSVNFITRQKLTEVYELASLFTTNQNDSVMRNILYPQISSYFLDDDSIKINKLILEMDSLQVHFVEIRNLNLAEKDTLIPDSVRSVNYSVRYFSQNKQLIDSLSKSAKYVLKKDPKKFKYEFVFYFTDINTVQEVKDTISSDVTQ